MAYPNASKAIRRMSEELYRRSKEKDNRAKVSKFFPCRTYRAYMVSYFLKVVVVRKKFRIVIKLGLVNRNSGQLEDYPEFWGLVIRIHCNTNKSNEKFIVLAELGFNWRG